MTVDVLIPVYNEAENIERTLDALAGGLAALAPRRAEISVSIVYDRPEDSTLPVLDSIEAKYPFALRRVRNPNPGVVGAIREGIRQSEADFVLVTMADLSDDYSSLGPMLEEAERGADVVCASRYMKGGQLHGGPWLKQLLSRLAGVSLHHLRGFPTHDITNSFKLYRREAIQGLELESRGGFEIGMEMTAKIHIAGGTVSEVPAQWWDRTAGESRFRLLAWLPRYLHWYLVVLCSVPQQADRPSRADKAIAGGLLALLAAAWLMASSSLSTPITDGHGFRQAQTAISVWAMGEDGLRLAYATPVLGRPWAIPMEFPLYQWMVALLARVPGMPLEMAGRLISLTCFWSAMLVLFVSLRQRVVRASQRVFLIGLICLSPLYLFWSRTFLIETLSLALCLAYVGSFHRGLHGRSRLWLFGSAVLGVMAALVKVTSLPAYLLLALLVWLAFRFRYPGGCRDSKAVSPAWPLIALASPLLAGTVWTRYTDHMKAAHPLAADFLTSVALRDWTFGTLQQRFSWGTWDTVLQHTKVFDAHGFRAWSGLELPLVLMLLVCAFILGRTRRVEVLACMALFFVNPICFTNLHLVHDYYAVPNALFLVLALGFSALSLLEDGRTRVKVWGIVLGACYAGISFHNYWLTYHRRQVSPPPYPAMASAIQRRLPADAILLIYGRDWNPMLPFAARRRALMDRWALPLESARMQAAIQATGQENIQGMLVPESAPRAFVEERCRRFGFRLVPVETLAGESLYIR